MSEGTGARPSGERPAFRKVFKLGPMPLRRAMLTVDEALVRASVPAMLAVVRDVERWPERLPHYRWVRFRQRASDGGGIVEMAANRPFGPLNWPTWWLSQMQVLDEGREASVRFRHIGGVTQGMEVEWRLTPREGATRVTLVHAWDGPGWPLIGVVAATAIIGPVFVHGIASRTLAGLARVADREARTA
ncbi:MAG TPA: SRPBCC family protein [Gemmatimonadaceae bacterium]|nr:SRPBCC family protein [Gemmatimonadaceae bacterium]